jgi:hypothetical protein
VSAEGRGRLEATVDALEAAKARLTALLAD